MKTIGLIGGISWHSTSVYYNAINTQINARHGNNYSAKVLLYSVNYNDFKQLQDKNDWVQIEIMLSEIAIKLEAAGADCILLCCNTIHLVAGEIKKKLKIPLLHIADETAKEIVVHKIQKVGLLGTKFTMENTFFSNSLTNAGIETIIPDTEDRTIIHKIILDELSEGGLSATSKSMFQLVIQNLKKNGAEAVVFACTEIGMFIQQSDSELRIFDTAIIHATAAVEFALSI